MVPNYPIEFTIIHIYLHELLNKVFKHNDNYLRKYCSLILQPKGHDCILKTTPFSNKCGLMPIFLCDSDLVIPRKSIHGVHLLTAYPFKDCYSGFHHTRWITHCMAFPCPTADSLAPMDHFLSFDVSLIIPKNIRKMIYVAFSPITTYIHEYSLYSCVHRDVYIIQNPLERSLTWIWLIWLLAFHMPWDRTDLTFQYPFEKLYKEPIETLKA